MSAQAQKRQDKQDDDDQADQINEATHIATPSAPGQRCENAAAG
jgi:hypothetical protein